MRLLILLCAFVAFYGCKTTRTADLIVHHAKVYTVDSHFSVQEAFAVKDGKIMAVGSNDEILTSIEAKELINAQGRTIFPGFIDAHAHFLGYGQSLFMVSLYGATSWDEVIKRVQAFAKEHPGEKWIRGRGWDQNLWKEKSFPSNEQLNELFPSTPVMLGRVDGHATVVNQTALDIAGIKAGQQLQGGEIEMKNGRLTGVLIDNAVDLVTARLGSNTIDDYLKWLTAAEKNCFQYGLTTVADCGLMYNDVQTIDGLQKEGKINMRLYIMLSDDTANYSRYLHQKPYKTDRMFVKGIKLYADGALGSRGACLLHPYNDKKNWTGFLLKDRKYFDSIANVLSKTGYQACVHAIGDSANREMLSVFNSVLKEKNDRRWRIEHAQVVDPADIPMFGRASIIPSVQPTHATSDMYWAGDRLGKERLKSAYAYGQLLQQNGWLPLGTDFPVEDISPFKTFFAAVFRKDAKGFPAGGFQPENALSREEALKGMTIWAAKGCFLEDEVGSLEPGKKADFIMLDKDLMTAGESDILNIKVLTTYSGGRKVH